MQRAALAPDSSLKLFLRQHGIKVMLQRPGFCSSGVSCTFTKWGTRGEGQGLGWPVVILSLPGGTMLSLGVLCWVCLGVLCHISDTWLSPPPFSPFLLNLPVTGSGFGASVRGAPTRVTSHGSSQPCHLAVGWVHAECVGYIGVFLETSLLTPVHVGPECMWGPNIGLNTLEPKVVDLRTDIRFSLLDV